ncbi:hypothetical protein FRC09_000961 [Ceratobasidium sp. 395]|nr:hypothetical protein FRC09_000961 [Ceratobasidium sp. 395]
MKGKHRTHTKAQITEILDEYSIHTGQFNQLETPEHPTPPLDYLPTHDALLCRVCDAKGETFIWRTEARRWNHFNKAHPDHGGWTKEDELHIEVQTFSPDDNTRKDFRVTPSLATPSQQPQRPIAGVNPLDVSRAFAQNWSKSAPKAAGEHATLKEAEPFVVVSGWGDVAAKYDIPIELSLTEKPESGPMLRVYDTAHRMFIGFMDGVNGFHSALRRHVTDETGSGGTNALIRLQSQEQRDRHASTWAMLLIYTLRVYQRQKHSAQPNPVTFTAVQKEWLDATLGYAEKRPGHAAAREVLLGLSSALWAPEDVDHLLLNANDDPVVLFAIFNNLNSQGKFFRPGVISSFLACLKYIMRLTTLMWVRDVNKKKQFGTKWMFQHVTKTLRSNDVSPYSSVFEYMGLATIYDRSGSGLGRVHWVDDQRTALIVDGKKWHLPSLRRASGELIEEIDKGIEELLFGLSPEALGLELSQDMEIQDRHAERTPGYSFLTDPKNPFLKVEQNLGTYVLGRENGRYLHRGVSDGKVVWNPDAVRTYLALHEKITNKMALSWHLSGGQPARAAEFATMSLTEDIHCGRAAIMINGRLAYLIQYSKQGSITRSDKAVAHCIPWVLTRQFLIMNALIRPFVGQLVRDMFGEERQLVQEHALFATWGKRMKAEMISDQLKWFFATKLGIEGVGTNTHRHATIEIQRKLMPEAADTLARSIAVVDAQAGHTSDTAALLYGLDSAERRTFLSTTINKFMLVSILWWPHIIPSQYLTPGEIHGSHSAPEQLAADAPQIDTVALADRIEERLTMKLLPRIQDQILQSQVSLTAELQEALNRAFFGASSGAVSLPEPTPPKALELLRRFTKKPMPKWTSTGQAKAMSVILGGQNSLLAILPTGGGKSLLFQSLPSAELGITLVVIPFIALMHTLTKDLTALDIKWTKYQASQTPSHGLVVASVEELNQEDSLLQWCLAAKSDHLLNRIVVDEAHLVVTAEYRDVMLKMHRFVEVGVQIIGLSATVPPLHEPCLRAAFGSPTWTVVREPTQRPNITLHALEALRLHIKHFTPILERQGDVIVIYCRTVKHLEMLEKELGIPIYHRDLDDKLKKERLDAWMLGAILFIAGTTALGAGIHNLRCVGTFHFGAPWGSVELAQEWGRPGRDGRPALCIMFHWGVDFVKNDLVDASGLEPLRQLLDSTSCLRELSRFIDGEALQVTCSDGYNPCGRCQKALQHAAKRQGTDLAGPDLWEARVEFVPPTMLVAVNFEPVIAVLGEAMEMEADNLPPLPAANIQVPQNVTTPPRARFRSPPPSNDNAMSISPPQGPTGQGGRTWQRRPTLGQGDSPTAQRSHNWRERPAEPAPIAGPSTVTVDAQRAQARAMHSIQAVQQQGQTRMTFTLPRVKTAMAYMKNTCVYCLVVDKKLSTHPLLTCPNRDMIPDPTSRTVGYDLSEVTYEGKQYRTIQRQHVFNTMDRNYKVCYRCWWPYHDNSECPLEHKDQVPQFCWLLLCYGHSTEAGQNLGVPEETCRDAGKWMYWASRLVDSKSGVLQAQRLILWWLEVKLNCRL